MTRPTQRVPGARRSPSTPRPRGLAFGAAVAAACLTVALGASPAHADPTPTPTPTPAPVVTAVPRPSVALPAALDVRPVYEAQVSCDPTDKPGIQAVGDLLRSTYGMGYYGGSRSCDGTTSEHYDGRAVDWMVSAGQPATKAAGDAATAWLSADNGANARRLGVMYVIWNKKMWRAYAPERGWAAYTGADPHTSHVHVSLTWDGAFKRTSWWTGRALTTLDLGPCRVYDGQFAPLYTGPRTGSCPQPKTAPKTSHRTALPGSRAADVPVAQAALGVPTTGAFDAATRAALLAYQSRKGLPRTGVLDAASWVALDPGSATGSPAPAPTPVAPAPVATPPVAAPPVGDVTGPSHTSVVTKPLPATTVSSLARYKATRLRAGSTGPAVRALQSALRVRVSGRVDAATVAAVKAVQTRWHLPASGAVDLRTWNRVDIEAHPWTAQSAALTRGSTGRAVVALQRGVGVAADGDFGRLTQAQVQTVQSAYGLASTGVVDAATWRAVAAFALAAGR